MTGLPRLSMRDRLVAELCGKILCGDLAPHTRLTEQEISSQYGVSRSVVREAMLVLELQGLINSTPYTGSEVASISREEVEGLLLPMRIQVEQYSLKTGFDRIDADYLKKFDAAMSDMERAVQNSDVAAFNTADIRFHELIIGLANSDAVFSIWEAIYQRIRMHFALQTGRTGALAQFLTDHRDVLETIRTGNLEASLAAIESHIIETNKPHLDLLDQSKDR